MLVGKPALQETKDRVQRLSKTRFLDVIPIQRADPSLPHSVTLVVNKAMTLDPERRYQTPGAVLSDLRIAQRRLQEDAEKGTDVTVPDGSPAVVREGDSDEIPASAAASRHVVMIVESATGMQDVFRNGLRKAGYRVLMTADPKRALMRLTEQPAVADCVIIDAEQIGAPAVEMFNRLAENTVTERLPAAVLLGESQRNWDKHARTSEHRLVVRMPITMRKLRNLVTQLIPLRETQAGGSHPR
jgi:eukaryotic-like serine/threonine-protein kinase